MNTLWFYFPNEKNRRLLHGTPADCMRKFQVLEKMEALNEGLEIFLVPAKLQGINEFEPWFYDKFSKLRYKTVHIADSEDDFLLNSDIFDKLIILQEMLDRLDVKALIIHAHHFHRGREITKELLSSALPGIQIYIENNGFDKEWGSNIQDLEEIFNDCPKYKLCLDIAHVKDFKKSSLKEFLSVESLRCRIEEIHISYSTHFDVEDLYAKRGYPGYSPFHALWSVIGLSPSEKTKQFIRKYPVVVEGVVPGEDKYLDFLKHEVELLS